MPPASSPAPGRRTLTARPRERLPAAAGAVRPSAEDALPCGGKERVSGECAAMISLPRPPERESLRAAQMLYAWLCRFSRHGTCRRGPAPVGSSPAGAAALGALPFLCLRRRTGPEGESSRGRGTAAPDLLPDSLGRVCAYRISILARGQWKELHVLPREVRGSAEETPGAVAGESLRCGVAFGTGSGCPLGSHAWILIAMFHLAMDLASCQPPASGAGGRLSPRPALRHRLSRGSLWGAGSGEDLRRPGPPWTCSPTCHGRCLWPRWHRPVGSSSAGCGSLSAGSVCSTWEDGSWHVPVLSDFVSESAASFRRGRAAGAAACPPVLLPLPSLAGRSAENRSPEPPARALDLLFLLPLGLSTPESPGEEHRALAVPRDQRFGSKRPAPSRSPGHAVAGCILAAKSAALKRCRRWLASLLKIGDFMGLHVPSGDPRLLPEAASGLAVHQIITITVSLIMVIAALITTLVLKNCCAQSGRPRRNSHQRKLDQQEESCQNLTDFAPARVPSALDIFTAYNETLQCSHECVRTPVPVYAEEVLRSPGDYKTTFNGNRPSSSDRHLIPVAFVSEKWFEISC
ncbi:PREDICTED: adherens junction-associated protein 1 [Haliaeetus leucocephalus]|nr:PREDICTED: adherens junction-associated protein 1 [Haliaeetus leucocephalus]